MKQSSNTTRLSASILIMGLLLLLITPNNQIFAQGETKWIRVGALHDWFSELGCEWEVGRRGLVSDQQDGLQWPARFLDQDSKAAKGMWIGSANYSDIVAGQTFPYKVVAVGPRAKSDWPDEVFPLEFKMIGRVDHPTVLVDGDIATDLDFDDIVDEIDPELKADRLLLTRVRFSNGVEMTRKVYAFGQQNHNNYFIYEFIFKNTGIVDQNGTSNPQTLQNLYVLWQYRYSICKEMGAYGRFFMPQNATWGVNTMNEAIGENPAAGDPFRAIYSWHGLHSGVSWDNIGAPNVDANGRLTSSQFLGVVTIHADKSPTDNSDDPLQPITTQYIDSDAPLTQPTSHNQYNPVSNAQQYNFMVSGHPPLSHAEAVGDGYPNEFLNTAGGFSQTQGYGPYTIPIGDSIRIVTAEAMAGINWDKTIEVGDNWQNNTPGLLPDGTSTTDRDEYKDAWVFTGVDSLYQTFQRATDNWNGGMDIPQPPPPPDLFEVNSGGDRIQLSWSNTAESWPGFAGYRVYRAIGQPDTTYEQIANLSAGTLQYDDTEASRGQDYYYYIISYDNGLAAGEVLESSLFYTRTNLAANLQRQAGSNLEAIRVVPNPYNIRAARTFTLGYGSERIGFLDIPAFCNIKIFTERGDLIQEIEHSDGSGDEYWDLVTSSRQTVVSGIYIAYFEVTEDYRDPETGEVLYRKGDNIIRKFVIVR